MMPDLPWKQEPAVRKGWDCLIQEIEARMGHPSVGDTLDEKMEAYEAKIVESGFGAFGTHLDLALAFLVATGRLGLSPWHKLMEEKPQVAAMFGDPEAAAIGMLSIASRTAFDMLLANVVGEFAQFGYDPNALTQGGDRLLHLAAENGKVQMVRALLAIGADPEGRDVNGLTALHRLLQSDLPPAVVRSLSSILIQCGASVVATSPAGVSVHQMLAPQSWYAPHRMPSRSAPCAGNARPC